MRSFYVPLFLLTWLGAVTAETASLELPENHIVVDGVNDHRRRMTRGGCHHGCPKDDRFDPQCLANAMPPYPICTKKTAQEWVESAIDGASRCCGKDLSECKCPVKDSEKFLNKIASHCKGVALCKTQTVEEAKVSLSSLEREELANEGSN